MSEKELPNCINCGFEYIYEVKDNYVCPECDHEWPQNFVEQEAEDEDEVTDANGVVLKNGDSVVVLKDLKVKGSSSTVKVGTKVKNIRLVNDVHDIDCKVAGIGAIGLKSKFVRKA